MKKIPQSHRRIINKIIIRIESADDFNYDDEQAKLNSILRGYGATWKWNGNKVEIISL